MRLRYLPHAEEAMIRRGIRHAWIEKTIASPDWTEADSQHPGRIRSFKAMEPMGGRALRVVHWTEGSDIVVLTAYPDRNALKQVQRP